MPVLIIGFQLEGESEVNFHAKDSKEILNESDESLNVLNDVFHCDTILSLD